MKATERFVIPADGLRVVDPDRNEPLPPKGTLVRGNDEYWVRRLNDGDVTVRPATKTAGTPAA